MATDQDTSLMQYELCLKGFKGSINVPQLLPIVLFYIGPISHFVYFSQNLSGLKFA